MVKPTLGQVFGLSLLGLAAVLALLFYLVFRLSRETIIESSERIRDAMAAWRNVTKVPVRADPR